MDYTQSIGNMVELQCLSAFIERGFQCSIPYGNAAKYDFIADVNGQLLKIQCKSCVNPTSKAKGCSGRDETAITINTTCSTTNTQKTIRHNYTSEQIDYFATYYQNKVYLIPVEECSTSKTLRFAPPKNGNKNYNHAEDYELDQILQNKDMNFVSSKERYEFQFKETAERAIEEQSKYRCVSCEINFVNEKGGRCVECAKIAARKVERPSREELKNMIRTESFLSLGKKFNVSDNAIRKWCKGYNLPFKKKDIQEYSDKDWEKI